MCESKMKFLAVPFFFFVLLFTGNIFTLTLLFSFPLPFAGDDFFIITEGEAVVTQKSSSEAQQVGNSKYNWNSVTHTQTQCKNANVQMYT